MGLVLTLNGGISKNEIFDEIKKCLKDSGFNMSYEGGTYRIKHIKESDLQKNGIKYSDYGLVMKIKKVVKEDVIHASFPTVDVPVNEGLAVYYAGFSDENGVYMCHKGRISSIKEESNTQVFTIDGSSVSDYPGSPVFIYDKIDQVLRLIGIITNSDDGSKNRAVHVDLFKTDLLSKEEEVEDEMDINEQLGEERGKKGKERVKVSSGGYKGKEIGTGKGPRSIKINGQGVSNLHYKLVFINGNGQETHPHDDPDYNDDRPKLYQVALNRFIAELNANNQVAPESFKFECYKKNPYIAKKEG